MGFFDSWKQRQEEKTEGYTTGTINVSNPSNVTNPITGSSSYISYPTVNPGANTVWVTSTNSGTFDESITMDDTLQSIRLAIPPDGKPILQYKNFGGWQNVPVQHVDRSGDEITEEQYKSMLDKMEREAAVQVLHEDDE